MADRPPFQGGAADRSRSPIDVLALVSVGAIASFITLLCVVAARDESARTLITPVIGGLGAGGLILFRQLRKAASSLTANEARALHAATYDQLTRLPNKSLFRERLAEAAAVEPDGAVSVFCIGLDRFDEVIEVAGVAAADSLVAEMAARLSSFCPETDTAARLGDSTFAQLRRDVARADAPAFAAELIEQLCGSASGPERAFVSCSVGVGFVEAGPEGPVEGLRQAQMAHSAARKLGGNRAALFQPGLDQALKQRKAMELDLRRALAEDELRMVYQPQVNARGVMVGVEALIRWTSPEHGEVSPSAFIPLAESCGLSEAVGVFALRRAFQDSRAWPGISVAVNVAAPHVRSGALVETLKTLLAETGRRPHGLELEITEGVLLADEPETLDTLADIRQLGFSIALDDFGTGYSSLSYLRRFPVDKIKIDQSFVTQLGRRPESSAIIKAIIDLAEALDPKVLAEGDEPRAQAERLARLGCLLHQGFFFSEPVDALMIGAMLVRGAALAA